MSTPQLAQLLTQTLVPASGPGPVVGARPALSTDGIDITGWNQGGFVPRVAMVLFDGDATGACVINEPAGGTQGVEVWGYILNKWKLVGNVNSGAAVPIAGQNQGAAYELDDLAPCTRLAIAGAPTNGASPTYSFAAMETYR